MPKTAKKIKLTFSPKREVDSMLAGLKDRDKYVLKNRFGLDAGGKKKTLESIGQEFSVTRERVRQIENAAIDSLRKSNIVKESNVFKNLRTAVHDMGGVVSEKILMDSLSDDPTEQNHINLCLALGDDFSFQKENDDFHAHWYIDEDMKNIVYAALRSIHREMKDNDVILERDMVVKFLDRMDGVEDGRVNNYIAKLFLSLSKKVGVNALGEWGRVDSPNIRARGIRDLAYLTMRKNGSPLHFTEIAEQITKLFGKTANPFTVHNEVIKDDRFVLVGRGLYGLKEWGYRSGVLRDIISALLKENGPMTTRQILERVKKERYLRDATILATLKNKKTFQRDEAGRYCLVD